MAKEEKSKAKVVEFGSDEHEMILAGGYGMSKEEAEAIIKKNEATPGLVPPEELKRAKGMLAALKTKPTPIDTAPGHFRKKNRYTDD